MQNQKLMNIEGIGKNYRVSKSFFGSEEIAALDNVSLELFMGKTLAIVGESGSGKTTLAKIIMRLENSSAGSVSLINKAKEITNIEQIPKAQFYSKIQMVFQDPFSSLNPRKKIWQIIVAPLVNCKTLTREESKDVAAKYLEMVGLSASFLDCYPHTLSGGQRQRVGIARALVLQPEILILDEPLSALDVSIQAQIINLLLKLQRELGLTYLFISHDLSVVKHFSDYVAVLYAGQLVEYGGAIDVIDNPMHPYTKALVESSFSFKNYRGKNVEIRNDENMETERHEKKWKKQAVEGEIEVSKLRSSHCNFASRCESSTDACYQRKPDYLEINVRENLRERKRNIACLHV
ncbi:ABC transporter ATP-binding protein [Aliikangiella coralliicola]|uniref:ABC transporter ATP-binding protein n=1 Tax=Aliikangiella coralliicola TaxID=2592383 RepID=UPI00143D92AF|nr:ABC transporter ATP-binding protein [Aliikangiella coralliicola]